MCKYTFLAQNENGVIRYCQDCDTYNIMYNNLLMNFQKHGMELFKMDLRQCYDYHTENYCVEHRDLRNVTISTGMDGLMFLFSTHEVGELLALIQEAQMSMIMEAEPNQ